MTVKLDINLSSNSLSLSHGPVLVTLYFFYCQPHAQRSCQLMSNASIGMYALLLDYRALPGTVIVPNESIFLPWAPKFQWQLLNVRSTSVELFQVLLISLFFFASAWTWKSHMSGYFRTYSQTQELCLIRQLKLRVQRQRETFENNSGNYLPTFLIGRMWAFFET